MCLADVFLSNIFRRNKELPIKEELIDRPRSQAFGRYHLAFYDPQTFH